MKYELVLKGEEAVAFKEQVKVKMKEHNLGIEELAEKICYSADTLRQFFKSAEWNRFLADSIAEELGIEFQLVKKVGEKNAKT